MTYAIAKQAAKFAEDQHKAAWKELKAISGDERGPMGLTPDHIKATKEWQEAFAKERKAFSEMRAVNMYLSKHYKKEIRAEQRKRRD